MEFADNVPQFMVVVGLLVTRNALPINRCWRDPGVGILLDNFLIELFRLVPFLVHEGHACQPHEKVRCELILGEITFDPKTLFAVFIEDEDGGRPDYVKAAEGGRLLLYMDGRRKKVFFNEVRQFLIGV